MNTMDDYIRHFLSRRTLQQSDLRQFTRNVPYRVVVNDSNGIDNNFLDFIYGIIAGEDTDSDVMDGDTLVDDDSHSCVTTNELMKCLEALKDRVQCQNDVVTAFDVETSNIDVQGLSWPSDAIRDSFLQLRQDKHVSFMNVPHSKEQAFGDVNVYLDDALDSWEFYKFWKRPRPALSHFQLRNSSICINSKNEVFYNELVSDKFSSTNDPNLLTYPVVKKINLFSGEISTVLELKADYFDRISSISCDDYYLIVGTLNGTYHIHNLHTGFTTKKVLTTSNNGIINFNRIIPGTTTALFSTNDGHLVTTDLTTSQKISTISFPWAVNYISTCPLNTDVKLLVGDNTSTYIMDSRISPSVPIQALTGHKDFCFASDWSHDGLTLATGSQDATVRLYDLRNLSKERYVMSGDSENAICTVQFNHNDKMLSFTESIDRVNVVELQSLHSDGTGIIGKKHQMSMFGKVIGAQFFNHDDEDGETMIVGVSDDTMGGILQYRMESVNMCLDYDFL